MNDEEEPNAEDEFDDPQLDGLQDLLASARVTDPVPDEVAARLDATLVSLQAERVAEGGSRNVVPLRRRSGRLLVAAAAVVVIGAGGVGIAQLGADSGIGPASTAERRSAGDADAGGNATSAPESADGLDAPGDVSALSRSALTRLSHATFARDAARVMTVLNGRPAAGLPEADTGTSDEDPSLAPVTDAAPPVTAPPATSSYRQDADCAGPEAPDAVIVPARLDGDPVALLFRPPTADAQQVEAWTCDGGTLLATASVPH